MTKFIATTNEMNKDTDIIAEDIRTAEDIQVFLDEVLDRADNEVVYVVGEDMTLAQNIAAVFNAEFEKEMELMTNTNIAKQEVNELVKAAAKQGTVDPTIDTAKEEAARKFLAKHGAAVKNAKKADKKEEEVVVEETKKKVTGRRRIAGANQTKTEKVENVMTKTNEEAVNKMKNEYGNNAELVKETVKRVEEAKKNRIPSRRVSTGTAKKVNVAGPKKKLARSENLRGKGFVKFEGPWYLNKSLYPVLERFESIIETMSDAELGIEAIHMVEPTEITRYANRADIMVVVQIKANGVVLEFPIKESTASNSASDLTSTSIGWVEYGGKRYPSFGFWRPNAMEVKMTCTCGNEFTANTGNVYCPKCKKRHDDIEVSMESALDFAGDIESWTFQTIPNVVVSRDVLALVMALAQYDADFDMHGVVAE